MKSHLALLNLYNQSHHCKIVFSKLLVDVFLPIIVESYFFFYCVAPPKVAA